VYIHIIQGEVYCMNTQNQALQLQAAPDNLAASGTFRAYCQQVLAAGVPVAEHGYYVRWLKLYLGACRQQGWTLGDLRYLNTFLEQISAQASTAFLRASSRTACGDA